MFAKRNWLLRDCLTVLDLSFISFPEWQELAPLCGSEGPHPGDGVRHGGPGGHVRGEDR